MEPFARKTLLVSLVYDFGLKISSFTTDRSSSISVENKINFRRKEPLKLQAMIQADSSLAMINHEYDPWHMISK